MQGSDDEAAMEKRPASKGLEVESGIRASPRDPYWAVGIGHWSVRAASDDTPAAT